MCLVWVGKVGGFVRQGYVLRGFHNKVKGSRFLGGCSGLGVKAKARPQAGETLSAKLCSRFVAG